VAHYGVGPKWLAFVAAVKYLPNALVGKVGLCGHTAEVAYVTIETIADMHTIP
jgi:hypothetical protein